MKIPHLHLGACILGLAMMAVLEPGLVSAQPPTVAFRDHAGTVTADAVFGFCSSVESNASGGTATVHADLCACPTGWSGNAYLVAPPGAPFPGSVTDQVSLSLTSVCVGPECEYGCYGTIDISCTSVGDAGTPVYPPPGVPVLVQDGQFQDVAAYLVDDQGYATSPFACQILVQSDLNLPVASPTATWGRLKASYR